MISFIIALLVLVGGYFTYGRYVSRVFGPDSRQTPCYTQQDGVDYMPMPTWKVYMIQFLNIAGLGPIFGAIMGAKFGTASYLWIVLGTIFAGAVHDYLSGMISIRMNGASLPQIIGLFLGKRARMAMCLFTSVLMILVGAVFVSGPAELLGNMTASWGLGTFAWIGLIFIYYIVATLCPVDKIIGKIYPFFAFCLIFMAIGLLGYMLINQPALPELWESSSFINKSWESHSIFPMMFITIACGAISGFHATQSPLMARCIKSEAMGRRCFYGAMVTEGIVALIWAAAATYFFGENGIVNEATGKAYTGAFVASSVCNNWLGIVGGILATMGIAVAPITSGDTALRSGRLIVADFFKIEQHSMKRRLYIAIPMFVLTAAVLVWSIEDKNGFNILWRYFAWCNQALSVFTLWAITVYLMREKKNWVITFLPSVFMTCVCIAYILVAPEGFGISLHVGVFVSIIVSVGIAVASLVGHFRSLKQNKVYPKI
ncbi:MAG: carbon starvation CstA family protein [Bacteroidales bacterium]|nr:carbon starvation CstA family protein [Bacteroidales bacterium]